MFVGVILAAGQGTRMKSERAKVLHEICGRPMVHYVLEASREAGVSRHILVVGHQAEQVRERIGEGPGIEYALQAEQKGTGHALLQAAPLLQGYEGHVLVLCGDTPLLTAWVLRSLMDHHRESGAAATLLVASLENPAGYGRVLRDRNGRVIRIVEERDAGPAEAAVREINTGIYCFRAPSVFRALHSLAPDNAQGEYYLTDVVAVLVSRGEKVETVVAGDPSVVAGINNRRQLAEVEAIMRRALLARLMDGGVTVVDPASTYVDAGVEVGRDTILFPFTFLQGKTAVGEGCLIGPGAHLVDTLVGNRVEIRHSVVAGSRVGDGASVGPYSRIRPGSDLAPGTRIGNFAEIKNSRVGPETRILHHSYVGDAVVGANVNIGAGVITVNYDGVKKHVTHIDDGAFVGCNSNLIAPVRVGEGAYVGAGSTITQDIPSGALGLARSRQRNILGWVARRFADWKDNSSPGKK